MLGMAAVMWASPCERPLRSGEFRYALGVELGTGEFNFEIVLSIKTLLGCIIL